MHIYNTNGNQNRYAKDLKSKKKKLNETKIRKKRKKWSLSSVCQLLPGLGPSLEYMSYIHYYNSLEKTDFLFAGIYLFPKASSSE